jgi:hypothetical protein
MRAGIPTLAHDFYEMYDELTRAPISVQVPGAASPARLDGVRFVERLRRQLIGPNLLPRIPTLIRELHHGERARAAELLMTGNDSESGFNATALLVSLFDVCGSKTLSRDADTLGNQLRPAFRDIRTLGNIIYGCEVWRERVADAATFMPVAGDIPTLIFSAEFDDRTPPAYGRIVAAQLKRSCHFEVPREAHGQLTPGGHTSMVVQFLENPSRAPDGACLQTMPSLAFETSSVADVHKFTFQIAVEGTPGRAFAGNWEALIPGSYGVTTIDLKIDGTKVTGTILQPRAAVNVFDGRIVENELIFKATSGDGFRTITLRGKLNGDGIEFTREFAVRPGGFPGAQGIFGAAGPSTITAVRLQ